MAYVPITPAGTALTHISTRTEATAWDALQKDAAHMSYKSKEAFVRRGYTVEYWQGFEPEIDK